MSLDTLLIARISGLPGDAIDPFVSEPSWSAVTEWHRVSDELQALRVALVETLFGFVRDAEPRLRHLLLDLKRACFNQRPIQALATRSEWPRIPGALGVLAEAVLAHERRLESASEELRRTYDSESARSLASLSPHLSNPRLLRGICVASSGLVEELRRQAREGPEKRGRKVRKAERSLLRYVTRAALKVSPYSTLTGIGAASLVDDPLLGELRLAGPPWEERSLLRVRRSLTDQLLIFLAHQLPARRRLRVALNTTIERLDDSVFRLLKPLDLVYEESEAELRMVPPSQVKVRLSGPVIDAILTRSWEEPPYLAELISDLAARCATGDEAAADLEESVANTLDQLLRLGFLELRTPWTAYETRTEESLRDFLLGLDLGEPLNRIAPLLSRLVGAEDAFARAPDPRAVLATIERALNDCWSEIVIANDLRLKDDAPFARSPILYEDVFLLADGEGADGGPVFRMPRGKAVELSRTGNSIARIFNLFNPRYNFLHSLAELLRRQGSRGEPMGFLELFAAAQPLWRDYVGSRRRSESQTFDPYSLPEIDRLRAVRRRALDELDLLRESSPNLPGTAFEKLAASLPEDYAPLVGCCLFVQPGDAEGRSWVMNRLLEGTGRFSCRFTAAMPDAMRRRFTERFIEASRFAVDADRIELLDVLYGRENTVNQHWPQTPKVLEIPGEWSDLPTARKLTLADLTVHLDAKTGLPILRGRDGIQYLPCQMNAVTDIFMPVLLKFLSMFGPLLARPAIFPSWGVENVDGMIVLDRLVFGSLIFRRKRWVVPASLLPRSDLEPLSYFREIGRRLQALGIPRQVFWLELIRSRPGEEGDAKPQFMDFSSPLLVGAFQDSTATAPEITFEEVVPDRTAFPLGADSRRWGIEVILESLLVEGIP